MNGATTPDVLRALRDGLLPVVHGERYRVDVCPPLDLGEEGFAPHLDAAIKALEEAETLRRTVAAMQRAWRAERT